MPILFMALLLLTSLLWAGNFVVGKFLVGHASSMTLTSLRWLIAVMCLFPLVWYKEKKLLPSRESWLPILFMGLSGVVFFNILQFWALEKTTANNVGLISTINPISIAISSAIFLKERIHLYQIFSMIFSFLGVLLVLTKGNLENLLSLEFNMGDLWMLTAVAVWGIYSVCAKWAMKTLSPILSTFYSGLIGLLILLPFNVSDFTIVNITPSFIWALIYTGCISTVVCMVLWNLGVQKLGATTAGIFLNFNPIFTAILAYFFLGEQVTWVQMLGGLIVITGCYLFTHFKSPKYQKRGWDITKMPNPKSS